VNFSEGVTRSSSGVRVKLGAGARAVIHTTRLAALRFTLRQASTDDRFAP
jgi:hypothetical protein